ncbi:MAG: HNH endonuclease [Acutalibacter sp.]|nr:HNH endonuclease [Acutalibacter sp.]
MQDASFTSRFRTESEEVRSLREFAKAFYLSKEWRYTRECIITRDHGLCVKCSDPGEIVHHIIPLTPENINDPEITLGEDNLELLCRKCHGLAHGLAPATAPGLMFDEDGNLVERELLS